ncbi:hypothetical protein GCM10009776_03260 [Microbacterium deminutum]|uniref:Uncharacterized protein n=1 Tax=Microbacterium deminutum TaxID=344164 RepID=A0ABN2Q527_9MICO
MKRGHAAHVLAPREGAGCGECREAVADAEFQHDRVGRHECLDVLRLGVIVEQEIELIVPSSSRSEFSDLCTSPLGSPVAGLSPWIQRRRAGASNSSLAMVPVTTVYLVTVVHFVSAYCSAAEAPSEARLGASHVPSKA